MSNTEGPSKVFNIKPLMLIDKTTHPPSISMVSYEHGWFLYGSRITFGPTKVVVVVVVVDALGTCGPIEIIKYLLSLQKSVM